eukprot:CAMPEP_0170481552 /NCGR_PEP_ID=MMETSP0208-20121228/1957_1 /TAXON_ID=197538 /ORGANISM="Strombidium inclinatum, Strain S3" /LENGTH=66 /DNA_ID=CAMNT_0010754281 /DNA_START=10 /DNA_END=210 /DNA_ORIENTATION=-
MATNKPSCAVCFSFLLSLSLLAFLIFIGYYAAFLHNREASVADGKQGAANQLVICFVIVGAILEVV